MAYFGGVPLKYNRWAGVNDQPTKPVWSGRSEVVERLLAQEYELCGSSEQSKSERGQVLTFPFSRLGVRRPGQEATQQLENQIFLGDDAFVEHLQAKIEVDRDRGVIPKAQCRALPKPLEAYAREAVSRDDAIALA
jgi:hypothetical protein